MKFFFDIDQVEPIQDPFEDEKPKEEVGLVRALRPGKIGLESKKQSK